MPLPHKPGPPPAAPDTRNPFVLFQKRFERRFNQMVERYGALLERVIDTAGSRDMACHVVFEAERNRFEVIRSAFERLAKLVAGSAAAPEAKERS